MVSTTLFDKYINLTLMVSKTPSILDLVVNTPLTGVKPNISIKGSLIPSYAVALPEVRITNFYSGRDLDEFKYIKVVAGYAEGLSVAFEGDLLIPYIEKPSPDSIVVFPMVLGSYSVYRESILVKEWPAGTMLRTIASELAASFSMSLVYDAEEIVIKEKVVSDGLAKDIVAKLCYLLPNLRIQFDSKRLLVYNQSVGRSDRYKLDKITMASKKGTALTVTGPWVPSMRPGDIVEIDPVFYKQALGSTLLAFTSEEFIVNVIDFSFGTITENNMIAYMLNKGAPVALDEGGYNG